MLPLEQEDIIGSWGLGWDHITEALEPGSGLGTIMEALGLKSSDDEAAFLGQARHLLLAGVALGGTRPRFLCTTPLAPSLR